MTFAVMSGTGGMQLSKRAAIAAVAALIGIMFAGSTLLTPLYVIYKEDFGFSGITLTLIYAAYVVGNLAALLVFGSLSDQIGRRRAMLPALAVAVLSTIIFIFAKDTAALFAGRILSGLGIGVAAGTANAWLAELSGDKTRAATISATINFLGLGLGPLLAGVLAQYEPWPLRLSFLVYLAIVLVTAAIIWRTPDTVTHRRDRLGDVSLRPRIGVPAKLRTQFVAPAVTGFGAMALVGFYAALLSSILPQELRVASHAAPGLLLFELTAVSAVIIAVTYALPSRIGMLSGLLLMVPTVFALVAAQLLGSMALMIVATALCGMAAGLGYRGSLQVVNQISPPDRRAELVSTYFVCCFIGNSIPVIGVGIISAYAGMPLATAIFAALIGLFALAAFGFGLTYKS